MRINRQQETEASSTNRNDMTDSNNIPSLSTPKHTPIRMDVDAVMDKLTTMGHYLGTNDISTKVAFVPGGHTGDRLVAKAQVNDAQPDEVRLSLVGEISRNGAWLSPEGTYRPGSMFGDKVTGSKAKFDLISPTDPELRRFAKDWEKGLSNIRAIHEAALKDKGQRPDRKDPTQKEPSKLTLRHALVIVSGIKFSIPPNTTAHRTTGKRSEGKRC
jgi:hypothetical protein